MRFPIFSTKSDIATFDNFFQDFKPLVASRAFCDDSRVMMPAVNISEDDSAFHIEIEAALMQKQDFTISVEKNTLSISGKRHDASEKKDKTYYRREIVSGTFSRSFIIPENVDKQGIAANHDNGVLHISLPKSQKTSEQVQHIAIQ